MERMKTLTPEPSFSALSRRTSCRVVNCEHPPSNGSHSSVSSDGLPGLARGGAGARWRSGWGGEVASSQSKDAAASETPMGQRWTRRTQESLCTSAGWGFLGPD